jgi:hypothetical protein
MHGVITSVVFLKNNTKYYIIYDRFIPANQAEVSKVDYSSKAKCCNVRDFAMAKNTVLCS